MGLLGDIAGGVLGAANTIYNLYTNERDFDYQKALQQQMFEREDTAVQRRMADLTSAGMNPNLAAGSAASAGSVVSRSNTNDVNMGSALDMIQAMNQIKQQKKQTEILDSEADKASSDAAMAKINLFQNMGIFDGFSIENNKPTIWYNYDGFKQSKGNIPLQQMFEYNLNYDKNSADMLQKANNWYTTNQILNAFGSVVGDISDIGGLFKPKFYKGRYQK